MNISFKKASAVGLCACLALTSLAGCSKKEEEFDAAAAAVTVNGTEIPAGVVSFATHYSQSLMESFYASYTGTQDPFNTDLYGNGTTLGSLLKDDVVSELTEMVLAEQKMGDYSVELTEEEKSSITAAVTAFIEDNDEEVLKEMSADQETVERYLELTTIKNKMEEAMTADVDTEVSDEEAAQRRVQYTMFTPSTETEAETDTENGTEAESDTDTENGAEADTENGTEAETTLETEGETAPETAALTEEETVKTQAAAETESETAAAGTEEVTEKAEEASADGAALETEAEESADTEAQDTEVSDTEALSEADTETETETETEDPAMVEARAKAKAQAQEMLDNIKGGMDFAEAAEAAGKSANEMTFGVGDEETRAELLAATDGLEDGTLVENVVETENGYYVVKLISQLDREATDAEKESIVDQRKSDRIEELYTEWKDAGEISQNDEVLATITFDFALSQYVEPSTEGATEAAAETELETDAETESEAAAETELETSTEAEPETAAEAESGTDDESESGTEAPAEEAATEVSTEAVTE